MTTATKPRARALKSALAAAVAEPATDADAVPEQDEVEATRASLMVGIGNTEDQLWLIDNELTALVDRQDRVIQAAERAKDREVALARHTRVEAAKPLEARRLRLLTVKAVYEAALASLQPTTTEIQDGTS